MDGSEGGSRYLSNYGENHGYGSTRMKVLGRNVPQPHSQLIADSYVDEDDELQEEEEDDEEEEAGDGDGQMNGSGQPNGVYVDNDDGDDDTDDNDNSNNNGNNNNNHDDDDDGGEDDKRIVSYNLHKHPKKRKLKSLLSSFELAPRAPPPLAILPPPATKSGGRNTLTDWSEHETFVLLDAWGERFLQRGRKSLRSEEWQEVAEKVSRQSKLERTDTQCRNRLDTLKKKYKKEKALLESNASLNSKWVYFKKMNMLMAGTPPQPPPPRANGLNGMRMRDSPDDTNSQDGYDDEDDDDLDILPPKKSKYKGGKVDGVSSFKLLADSINRFSDTYEKIENSKRKQMLELEKMRMDFYKDLELQKMKILDRARDEIVKIRQGDHEENDDSAENLRG